MVGKKTSGRGGARENAGRKSKGAAKISFSTALPRDVVEWLAKFESRNVKLEELCRAAMAAE